ncbi:MAG: hypothetical protein V4592_17850 [Bacteroidota bacterium]
MQTKFTTSVNIIRDADRDISYIPTPNAVRTVNQISNDFKIGIRSFDIIGAYGTGKSSFLWAFQQSLAGRKKHFGIKLIDNPNYRFINFVGEFRSLIDTFAEYFAVEPSSNPVNNLFSEIYNSYHDLGSKNPLLVIVIDEFGKFLAYAAEHEPEKELYFIQQLAEFVNNPDRNILLLTTLHQNFDQYAYSLTGSQKHEWTKVKGRFRELTFNEPPEQLLFLAAEHAQQKALSEKQEDGLQKALALFKEAKSFNFNPDAVTAIAQKLYPFELFSANTLTILLQRYGQNERSLFSFLESTDHTGIIVHAYENKSFYNLSHVYDYLLFNFYSFINSRYNEDYLPWKIIKSTIENAERTFDTDIDAYVRIIKSIGLLNIVSANGANLDRDFLVNYSATCLGVAGAEDIIDELVNRKLIFYRNYSRRFILFEGTDLDIQLALIEAGNKVESIVDITTLLNKYYQLPPIIAKEVTYKKGTPRLFEYVISEEPKDLIPEGEIDGFINLIFNEKIDKEYVKKYSLGQHEAILYGFYKNPRSIRDLLFEIEKTKKVIDENGDDIFAIRELNNIMIHQQNLLNHKILNNFYSRKKEVIWIYRGQEIDIDSKKVFNKRLSSISNDVYDRAPTFMNELVNKNKISASIHTAKRLYFKALANHWDKPQLNFPKDKFPPEKTIYLSLLESNGIQLYSDVVNHEIAVNNNNNFHFLWEYSMQFLESAKVSRRKISEFEALLKIKPYKLKQGLIDFWIPTFLFIKRDDFAIFGEHGYIPYINDDVLELVAKYPDKYEIKTFDIQGVKFDLFNSYRLFLEQSQEEKITNSSFIQTIKPFITFYSKLPDYSKHTKRLTKEALNIREAIIKSEEPENTFFEVFPRALGFTIDSLKEESALQKYIDKLQSTIRELRTCYDELVNRVELFIQNEIIGEELPFEGYTLSLQNRYSKLKKHLLLPHQRKLVQRIDSALDDKFAWLDSIAQAICGSTLLKMTDETELEFYEKFKFIILELDSLTELSTSNYSEEREDLISVEISSFANGMNKKMVRLPKNKSQEVLDTEVNLRKTLSKDQSINITALANILKEILNK